jgi:glycine cleavage system H protein
MYPKNYRYTKDHEWINVQGDVGIIGITDHAQEMLGDIVFVELPDIGRSLKAHESFGTIESVKAVSDAYSPVSGEVAEVHQELQDEPEIINKDPHGDGWIIKLKLADPAEVNVLMDADTYEHYIAEEKTE